MTEQDLKKLDTEELIELLAALEGMDDYLKKQEEDLMDKGSEEK